MHIVTGPERPFPHALSFSFNNLLCPVVHGESSIEHVCCIPFMCLIKMNVLSSFYLQRQGVIKHEVVMCREMKSL